VSDHYPVDVLIQSKSGPLRVGVFKIQVFGRTKVGKEDVLSILVKVVLIFLLDYIFHNFYRLFTAGRNARIASAVLATAIPSVHLSVRLSVCLSVTRRYCVKTTARSTVQFALLNSKMCLVL